MILSKLRYHVLTQLYLQSITNTLLDRWAQRMLDLVELWKNYPSTHHITIVFFLARNDLSWSSYGWHWKLSPPFETNWIGGRFDSFWRDELQFWRGIAPYVALTVLLWSNDIEYYVISNKCQCDSDYSR